jgi:hypothetical protein
MTRPYVDLIRDHQDAYSLTCVGITPPHPNHGKAAARAAPAGRRGPGRAADGVREAEARRAEHRLPQTAPDALGAVLAFDPFPR